MNARGVADDRRGRPHLGRAPRPRGRADVACGELGRPGHRGDDPRVLPHGGVNFGTGPEREAPYPSLGPGAQSVTWANVARRVEPSLPSRVGRGGQVRGTPLGAIAREAAQRAGRRSSDRRTAGPTKAKKGEVRSPEAGVASTSLRKIDPSERGDLPDEPRSV